MDYVKNKETEKQTSISLHELRMKQSVRTTFKLPKETINLLTTVAVQLGIKQKSLLDQLTEDRATLKRLIQEIDWTSMEQEGREAKTYVMSRSSLQAINDVAKKEKVPRDVLVEISINRLLPIIEKELENHLRRKKVFEEMQCLFQGMKELRTRARKQLGEEDTLFAMVDAQMSQAKKNLSAAKKIIAKGMVMEDC